MITKRKLITKLTDKQTWICYEINTEKFKYGTNLFFEKRYMIKIKVKSIG